MNLVSFSKQNPVGMEDQAELACFVSKCLLGKLHVANAEGNSWWECLHRSVHLTKK